jgi:N-methylhydantoinase B
MNQEIFSPIKIELYKNQFWAIAEEMGVTLCRTGYSPNIKERRDYSCALFDHRGEMIAQADHMPVHLGSMPLSVLSAIENFDFFPGDVVILNDSYRGGTHLPDITLVTPIFFEDKLFGFSANRAHHADIGGMSPGSMPLSQELFQEGLIIPPIKLYEKGVLNKGVLDLILANVRTPQEREGDLRAQIAANEIGKRRILDLLNKYGLTEVTEYIGHLKAYSERMVRNLIAKMPDGEYTYEDFLDDDGITEDPIKIAVKITIQGDQAKVDFSGSSPQVKGCLNCVYAITVSAVFYVFRLCVNADIASNSGCLTPIQIIAPRGSIVNAEPPHAVAGGNVETSQRIVDVLLGALAQALPDRVPAASSGTMNNLTLGGYDPKKRRYYTYYETIAGGMGARPGRDGIDGIHTHMTNTMNTPIEALEYAYPFRVTRYHIRRGSGGAGRYRGGDGIRRDIQVLQEALFTILSDRRKFAPYGLQGGEPGQRGENYLIRDDQEIPLPSKCSLTLKANDIVSIRTPGGGGFGRK